MALSISVEDVSESAREKFNDHVKPKLLDKYASFFEQIEKQPLSQPQREACVTNEDHTLVVAGAGTGKTSTIIGKAGYLLSSGLAQAENILMLAFGNKAASEMGERIAERLPSAGSKLKATTFHAFGNRVVAETQGQKLALTRFSEQVNELHQFIENVIEQRIIDDADYKVKLVRYFVSYSTPGRCEYDFNTIEEYHEFLESCRLITLNGEFVKSVGELRVANFCTFSQFHMRMSHPTFTIRPLLSVANTSLISTCQIANSILSIWDWIAKPHSSVCQPDCLS